MVWGRVFGQKIKIPAKIVRYREGKRKLVIDLRLMARSCHSSMIYLLWMYSHFMAPEICHWIFKMNGSFPPFLPPLFSLSPFFFSHLFLCWSDCYLEMFQKSCLWSTFLLMVPESSGHLAASLSVGKGAAVLFCTWILVTGSRWTCPSVVQLQGCDRAHSSCLKVTNKSRGLFKVSMVRGNPGRKVLDPHTICSARALRVWVWRWNVCTGEEPFTRWLCK